METLKDRMNPAVKDMSLRDYAAIEFMKSSMRALLDAESYKEIGKQKPPLEIVNISAQLSFQAADELLVVRNQHR